MFQGKKRKEEKKRGSGRNRRLYWQYQWDYRKLGIWYCQRGSIEDGGLGVDEGKRDQIGGGKRRAERVRHGGT